MQVIDAKVDWYKEYCNLPVLQVLVDQIPSWDTLRWEKHNHIYYCISSGYVAHLFYKRSGHGFGGSSYKLKMKDGSIAELRGPFSTRASILNYFDIVQCTDVSLTDEPKVLEKGYTYYSGCITLELAKQAAKLAGVNLVKYCVEYNSYDSDLAEEQTMVVNSGLVKPVVLHIDEEIPDKCQCVYVPSLSDNKIVKEK